MKHLYKLFVFVLVTVFLTIAILPTRLNPVASANSTEGQTQQPDNEPVPSAPKRLKRKQASIPENGEAGEIESDDPFIRLQAEYKSRGAITPSALKKHSSEAKRQRAEYPTLFSQTKIDRSVPTWRSLGPTSDQFIQNSVTLQQIDSGRLRTILPHPTDPNIVYVLSAGGGLWKSTNFTSPNHKWRPLTDLIGTTAGGSVAFGRDPNTLYLGTGDPFAFSGGFMVMSRNGGNTWSDPVQLGNATKVLDVKVDSTVSKNDIVLTGTDQGLFRSTDEGQSFAFVAFPGHCVWSLVKTSAGWLASVQEPNNGDLISFRDFGILGFGPSSLYLSTDRGLTWSAITNTGNGFSNAGRTTLAVGRNDDSIIYAFAALPGDPDLGEMDQSDLFRSVDGGQTWLPLHITHKTPMGANDFQPDMDILNTQAFYNQLILVDPTDPSRNTVYLGGQYATAKTTDGGNTWKLTSDWLPTALPGDNLPYVHADCHAAAFSSFGGTNTIFFGTDGGLAVSNDEGETWDNSKNIGLVDQLVYTITASAVHPEQTMIGLQDLGTRFRIAETGIWNQVFGGDGTGVGWSQANDNESFCTVPGNRYFRVLNNPPDNQSKFRSANFFFYPDYFQNFFSPVITPSASFDASGYLFVTHGPTFIYYTFDRSARWAPLANIDEGNGYGPSNIEAGAPFTTFFRDQTTGLGMSPDTTAMGVCATGGRVALSTDNENSWSVVSLNAEVPDTANSLGFHSFTSNVLWATNSDVYVTSINPAPGVSRVVRSSQGGAPSTWSAAQNGLPDVPVSKLIANPNDPKTIYAATDLGVYRTIDSGDHWSLFGSQLPQVCVTDLYIPPNGSFLRIATYGRGVWEISL
jgi:photosystem II stability/assembly factor-like uncharacterized protein